MDSGGYVDHRILRDGDQTYILLLTDVQPKPDTKRNNLQIFALQGGQLQLLQLPETLGFNRKVFTSMDGRLMLTCTDFLNAPAACGAIRIEGGKLMILKQGALAGQPATEAQQASEQANAKFKAGAYVEAAQTFRQTVELAPTWIDAWNDLSFAYQKAGDWQAALIAARTASNLDAKSGAALYNAGVSYLGLGDSSRAISMLDQAVKLQADSPDTWLALGKAREQAWLRTTAVEAYKKVLSLDPGNKEAAEGLKRLETK
jgi:tetratricopeptide (TPR) repeat protein